ncbi:MAG: glycosyltransferase family 39 protein [bacterium]|nr:glycosyltransferase family 39 protein [bacterium]
MTAATRSTASIVGLAATVFVLAYFSPVEAVDSDPAIALLVSQALLEHHTLRLDVYRDDPRLAYDLGGDYRLRRRGDGAVFYYSPSVAVLSLPFVAVANLFGFHMLDQATEHATQNLLSALCAAAVFVLLFLVCRCFLPVAGSLAVTAVSVLGSPLISTVGAGLWSSAYAAVLLSLAVLTVSRWETAARRETAGGRSLLELIWLGLVLGTAFVARPASAFAVIALMVYLLGDADRRLSRGAAAALLAIVGAVGAGWLGLMNWMPVAIYYYSPTRLFPQTDLGEGLLGTLMSPSRGLLVFCPFLAVVATAAAARLRELWANRLVRFALAWIVLHVPAAATRPVWWGGHSFGPRLLIEIMPPLVLLTCVLWQYLDRRLSRPWRTTAVGLYLWLGAAAILVHTGQGLFNPHTRWWNERPNVDDHPEMIFDWRYPQFLASEALLERRSIEHQRRTLGTYALGEELSFTSPDALFHDWYPPEGSWRWSRGKTPRITLRLGNVPDTPLFLLSLSAGSLDRQEITVEAEGVEIDRLGLEGFEPASHLITIPPRVLTAGDEVTFGFRIPGARRTGDDPRRLGLALRSLRLFPVPADFAGVTHRDDPYFLEGFSSAEAGWRWTDGETATLALPAATAGAGEVALELTAGALGRQRIVLSLDGRALGELVFEGFEPATHRLAVDAPPPTSDIHRLRIETPDAVTPPGETRRLGLALVSLKWVREQPVPRNEIP